jgi:dolichol-phosphate mannosyltransferase
MSRSKGTATMSIIIPTYNESQNILKLIESIKENLPYNIFTEIIIVDDNSPDGTGKIVERYIQSTDNTMPASGLLPRHREGKKNSIDDQYTLNIKTNDGKNYLVKVIHRPNKSGLISAIMEGINASTGYNVLVMDADFSHPPETIPQLVDELLQDPNCIVIASRYTNGGSIIGWPYKRRVISISAAKIARLGLKIRNVKDPLSGFFAFPRHSIRDITINTKGYKLLLEILVKLNGAGIKVKEIPYTFTNRTSGESKLDASVMLDYTKAVWHLYRYGQNAASGSTIISSSSTIKRTIITNTTNTETKQEKRKSVLFLSKAGRFYTVGATGLFLNYLISMLLSNGIVSNFWYLQSTLIGIMFSITSNFFINKAWTFEDKNFSVRYTLRQYGTFAGISSIGAAIQLALLFLFVESGLQYGLSLIMAVAIASASNFLLNKKWTFREKVWG